MSATAVLGGMKDKYSSDSLIFGKQSMTSLEHRLVILRSSLDILVTKVKYFSTSKSYIARSTCQGDARHT
jgi:hypothetical protein